MVVQQLSGASEWPFEFAREEMAMNFPRRGQSEVSLNFNQCWVTQKNINVRPQKAFAKGISPLRSAFHSPFVWVGGKGIRTFWLPWLYVLFWLGLIVKSVKKGWGAWQYEGGEWESAMKSVTFKYFERYSFITNVLSQTYIFVILLQVDSVIMGKFLLLF